MQPRAETALVLGASGQDGAYLAELLVKRGLECMGRRFLSGTKKKDLSIVVVSYNMPREIPRIAFPSPVNAILAPAITR